MDKSQIRILVVDDEPGLCAGIREVLRREGYTVDAVTDSLEALKLAERSLFNLVISDIKMPQLTGVELLARIKASTPDTQVILMTAYGTVENAVQAMKIGAYDYLTKPLEKERLRALVLKALEHQAVVAENLELRRRVRKESTPPLLIGCSEVMRDVNRQIDEVTESDVTVLIQGDSGTGKELVARSIHMKSRRCQGPFVVVNCAALPEQLLESELFGHVKGAFTGALHTRHGRFHAADGGTLFLDEIGDLSAKGQGDLLRVIEEGLFQMVGGSESVRVDVRLVTATNKNLELALKEGRFREDLYYRLSVFPIRLPALRDRAEDIPLLAASFLEQSARRHRRRVKTLSAEAMQVCQRFPWPGNVRQLRNAMERLAISNTSSVIQVAELPDFLRQFDQNSNTFTIRSGMSLSEVEKLLIRMTLTHVTSNREEAARILGISRRSLQYKLKEYGLIDYDHPEAPPGESKDDGISVPG